MPRKINPADSSADSWLVLSRAKKKKDMAFCICGNFITLREGNWVNEWFRCLCLERHFEKIIKIFIKHDFYSKQQKN